MRRRSTSDPADFVHFGQQRGLGPLGQFLVETGDGDGFVRTFSEWTRLVPYHR